MLVRALLLVVIAGVGVVIALMPPRAQSVADVGWTPQRPVVRGAYHIHSQRSDGSGTVEEIAAAAARVGLDFVILTDHGDGTRPPDPPTYRSGVLCLDGVEISTNGGHYVALGMPAAPYPLGGWPSAVVEDVTRLGGFGIAAHPDSAKPELRWGGWDLDFGGLEWLNADSEWRDESAAALAGLLLTYWFRPVETLADAIDRPAVTIDRWDVLAARRRVPALAGADAHARIGADRSESYQERAVVYVPSYDVSFQTFQNHVVLDAPFTGDAAVDGARLLAAIREGRLFTTLDGSARSTAFELVARSGEVTAQMGEYLDVRGPVTLDARVAAPGGATMVLMRDGAAVHETTESQLRVDIAATDAGAYRVEVRLAGRPPVPWLLSNPIYVGLRERHAQLAAPVTVAPGATATELVSFVNIQPESDPRSTSTPVVQAPGDARSPLVWAFTLGDGPRAGQFAAARLPASGLAGVARVAFRVSAERPMRAWLQLRAPSSASPADTERWGASFYADGEERDVVLDIDTFVPIGVTATASPTLERIDSLLFVADMFNSRPGSGNTLRVSRLSLARR